MALERATWLERRYGARIEWLPFDLHPEYPQEGIPRARLTTHYGKGFHSRVQELIEDAGFVYDPPPVVPNAMRALELAELARDAGRFRHLHALMFEAHWSEHRDIGDLEVLRSLAATVGLDMGEVEQAHAEERYRERIAFTTQAALELGIRGVPAWLIDDKLMISGAKPHEVFEQAMSQLGHPPRSDAQDVGSEAQ